MALCGQRYFETTFAEVLRRQAERSHQSFLPLRDRTTRHTFFPAFYEDATEKKRQQFCNSCDVLFWRHKGTAFIFILNDIYDLRIYTYVFQRCIEKQPKIYILAISAKGDYFKECKIKNIFKVLLQFSICYIIVMNIKRTITCQSVSKTFVY
ncbi:hypothetical protein XENORESO_021375 [Xenotaenia resolanae]|uniref:Uncharacterized protein n=1 Tax=Xenotaenia resolanae TaxID=208358 RepID=A0ABV0WBG9_9TELE